MRCAACRHSWFEQPPVEQQGRDLVSDADNRTRDVTVQDTAVPHQPAQQDDLPPPVTAQPATARPAATEAGEATAPPLPPSWSEGAPARPAMAEPIPIAVPPASDPFAYQPPFRQRRNPARFWTIIAVATGLLLVALNIALILLGGIDGIAARINGSSGRAAAPSPLHIVSIGPPERRRLDSGHMILTVSGRIENPTNATLPVPDVRATIVDANGRTLYRWTIPAPMPQLGSHATVGFDAVAVDAPAQGRTLRLGLIPPGQMP